MTAPGSRGGGLTPAELRLAEEYVWILDFVSRCALGVDRGDWFYLYDKAGELQRAAGRLAELAHDAYQAYSEGHGPRPAFVRAAVAWHGRHYRAGRLLHPATPRGRQ
jgi:hypothetical protein